MADRVRLLSHRLADGPTQMATDEALLDRFADEPVVRTYAWERPTLSLGYFQDHAAVLATLPVSPPGGVVRRITGGGAIWHAGEVTWCLVGRPGRDGLPRRTRDCYGLIHGRIAAALADSGHPEVRPREPGGKSPRYRAEPRCFAAAVAGDLVDPAGAKVLGSAARTRRETVLIHGSLKLASNPWDGSTVAGCGLAEADAVALLESVLTGVFAGDVSRDDLTPAESDTVEKLKKERYGDDRWVRLREGPRP